jgi:Domain of unknown function (DUF4380)
MSNDYAPTIEQINFRGWDDAQRLSNGVVSLVVVPAIGGRIIAYDLASQPYFYLNPELAGQLFTSEQHIERGPYGWKNYGGDKTWPAPQGWPERDKWPGPPDPVLDGGPFELIECGVRDGVAAVTMRSQPDPYTGTQITRRLSLGAATSAAHLHIEMQNISDKPVQWSVWDVAQLDCTTADGQPDPACTIYLPLDRHSRFATGYHLMVGPPADPTWQPDAGRGLLSASYQGAMGKVGIDRATWLGFTRRTSIGSYAFTERFAYEEVETYPDSGVNAECWSNGPSEEQLRDGTAASFKLWYMEMEVLSPLRELAPGARQSLDIDWGVAACPGPIVGVGPLGCVNRPLTISRVGNDLVASGSFGLFYPGKAALIATSATGEIRYLKQGWMVSAGGPLLFDSVHIPIDTTNLSLALHSADGRLLGEIDTRSL